MPGRRGFDRTERLNELLREIVAEELAKDDDLALGLVTITGVDVDRELEKARVFYTTVDGDETAPAVRAALEHFRPRARRAIGRQARLRRTPDLAFLPDSAQRQAERIEEILRQLHRDQ